MDKLTCRALSREYDDNHVKLHRVRGGSCYAYFWKPGAYSLIFVYLCICVFVFVFVFVFENHLHLQCCPSSHIHICKQIISNRRKSWVIRSLTWHTRSTLQKNVQTTSWKMSGGSLKPKLFVNNDKLKIVLVLRKHPPANSKQWSQNSLMRESTLRRLKAISQWT